MEDKLSIRVPIAERYYPLKIDRSKEEYVRQAAKLINEKVLAYKQLYADKDAQDWLAMAAMYFALRLVEGDYEQTLTQTLDGLKDLDKKLAEYLDYVIEK